MFYLLIFDENSFVLITNILVNKYNESEETVQKSKVTIPLKLRKYVLKLHFFIIIDVVTKQDALILPYVATLNVIQVVKDC